MAQAIKRAPVRIQIWLDNVRIDVRGWLDDFSVDSDFPPGEKITDKGVTKFYSLKAHNNWLDAPWRFHRGKPGV